MVGYIHPVLFDWLEILKSHPKLFRFWNIYNLKTYYNQTIEMFFFFIKKNTEKGHIRSCPDNSVDN